jgi:luciferase family oxidoreductase group 1
MINLPLSLFEVAMIESGKSPGRTLPGFVRLARRAEELGYHRVWYAEHHSSRMMADFSPAVLIAHVAAATSTIRVGSGAVLAPNHPPLTISEQFSTLAALHPQRIDLGIGRGPGTFDEATARALRWGAPPATNEEYGERVAAILQLAWGRPDVPEPWLLSSSIAGATLAAEMGLPVAFAHHIRPDNTAESVERYRENFKPSRWSDSPRVMLSVATVCAETETRAAELARPAHIVRINLMNGAGEMPLPSLEAAASHLFTAREEEILAAGLVHQAQGTPEQVGRQLVNLGNRFGADELILVTPIYDPAIRARSCELVAQVAGEQALRPIGLVRGQADVGRNTSER